MGPLAMRRTRSTPTLTATLLLIRRVCAEFPEVTETASWGHPNFKAGKKIFAAVESYGGVDSLWIRTDPETRDSLLMNSAFSESRFDPHGRAVLRKLQGLTEVELRALLEHSYRQVALPRMIAALDGPPRSNRASLKKAKRKTKKK
jgi:hypothetical protein